MLKRIPEARAQELANEAAQLPASNPRVSYPGWYLHRWHFLPEGYLSNRSAAGYELVIRHVYNQGLERRTFAAAARLVRALAPASVIEVGCGPGHLIEALRRHDAATDIVGIDMSPYLLARARRRLGGQRARLVHADGLDIPAEEGAFDVAISSHYVGHLPDHLRSQATRELARVVRPGGHVLMIEHRWHSFGPMEGLRAATSGVRAPGFVRMSLFERVDGRQ